MSSIAKTLPARKMRGTNAGTSWKNREELVVDVEVWLWLRGQALSSQRQQSRPETWLRKSAATKLGPSL